MSTAASSPPDERGREQAARVNYRIYAIRYGHLQRKSGHNFLGGDEHETSMPLDYYVWLVTNDVHTVLVDTGFEAAAAYARGRTLLRPVADGLMAIGIEAHALEDVVITHMHYDHAGGLGSFPAARFHVQDDELAYCTGRAMTHRHLSAPFDAENVLDMIRRVFDGRVVFHRGEATLYPGITLHPLPGHTPGLQAVRVQTARGPVVLASDALHFYANLERATPFPIVVDVPAYLESLRQVRALAPTLDHLIPGHDPAVLANFPDEPGVPDVVRLDLAPRRGRAG